MTELPAVRESVELVVGCLTRHCRDFSSGIKMTLSRYLTLIVTCIRIPLQRPSSHRWRHG